MKHLKYTFLIFLILACCAGTASAMLIYPHSQDQSGNVLSDYRNSGYISGCNVDAKWEYYNGGSISQVNYMYVWPFPSGDWLIDVPNDYGINCISYTDKLCSGRYSFDRITAGDGTMNLFVGLTASSSPYLSNYKRVCYYGGGKVGFGYDHVYARYTRNAKYSQSIVLDLVPQTATLSGWYPVGTLIHYSPPNREASHQFYYATHHFGSGFDETVAEPYGNLQDMQDLSGTTNPQEHYDPHYLTGGIFNLSTNLPSPLSLPTARYGHTMTLLPNGKILSIGGGTSGNPVNNALLDLSTDTWSDASKNFDIQYHTATLLQNGKVLVAGGQSGGSTLNAARLYDPADDTWSEKAPMNTARRNHAATLLPDGKVLVAGGQDSSALKSTELYDPAANTWTAAADLPAERYGAAAQLLPNGKVLVAGGRDINGTDVKSAVLYDPLSDTWTAAAYMSAARYAPAISVLTLYSGGTATTMTLVTGGSVTTSIESYNPGSNAWSLHTAQMATGRSMAAATQLPDGKVLVSGGNNGVTGLAGVELFELAAGGTVYNRNAYNIELSPVYTPAPPRTAPFTGTKWMPSSQTSLSAGTITAQREEVLWVPMGWTNGSGRVPAAGSSATVNLGPNADSTIRWNFIKHYPTRIIAGDSGMPDWVKAEFERLYDVRGNSGLSIKIATSITNPTVVTDTEYRTPADSSTIYVPERITRVYNGVEENWVLEPPVLPAWATMTYDSVNQQYVVQQSRQFLRMDYHFVYTRRLDVAVGTSGVDDADKAVLQNLTALAPLPSAAGVTYRLNEAPGLTAPNLVYARDNSVRYVLTGWSGTGSIGNSNVPSGGLVTSVTYTITGNSSITWNYKKQVRVKVTTVGEDKPLNVYDLAGDTSAGSATVANVATTGIDTGMAAVGYGIPDGTTVTAVNPAAGTVLLSTAATQTYAGTAGQRLTFATVTAAGSADPRECASPAYDASICAGNSSAERSGVHFYDVYTMSQESNVSLTALQSFTDSTSGTVRTLTQVIYSGGGIGNMQQIVSGTGRKALTSFNIDKPMTVEWRYDQTKAYIIGRPMLEPDGQTIDRTKKPVITIIAPAVAGDTADTAFVWAWDNSDPDNQGMRYFPIHPVESFTISWPITGSSVPFGETCMTIWPARQKHIAEAPANLQPPDAANTFNSISYTTNAADATQAVFNARSAGTSVLRFATPPVNLSNNAGTAFIVVQTETFDPASLTEIVWRIGSKITDAGHRDPENEIVPSRNKSGYLFFDGGVYDGSGPDKAYDRSTRSGAIIPVNKSLPGDMKPLVVVWYERGQGDIGWPVTPKRYKAGWPSSPATITIGTGIPVSPTAKLRAVVYNQPDKNQPGFNPNEEHALLTGDTLYALRDDLNAIRSESEPYVLLKYFSTESQQWMMDVYKVARPNFTYTVDAGSPVVAPLPGSFRIPPQSDIKKLATNAEVGGEWHLRDHKGGHWAKASNWKTGDAKTDDQKSKFVMQWYYYMRSDFYWPFTGSLAKAEGDVVPFLNNGSRAGNVYVDGDKPIDVTYVTKWPDDTPVLPAGDTLTTARDGLPDLYNFKSAEVIFDENVYKGGGPLAKLFAPERYLYADLASIPVGIKTETGTGGVKTFPDLPFAIQARLFYDPVNKKLGFKGTWISNEGETPWLLPNLMTTGEKATIRALSTDAAWTLAADTLYTNARNPNINKVDYTGLTNVINPFNAALSDTAEAWQAKWGIPLGLELKNGVIVPAKSVVGEKNALTAGMAQGEGYVVVAENNDGALLDAPVQLHVINVSKSPVYQGTIKAIKSKNVFDEKLTLHYTGDFGGEPEKFNFEWYYQPVSGDMPKLPEGAGTGDWLMSSVGNGLSDITISGASPLTMSDNWFAARYYYKNAWPAIAVPSNPVDAATPQDDQNNWSKWSGANLYEPMLAMGWVKRVVDGVNPLEARVTDFRNSATDTTVSMLSQFGTRYEGPVAMSDDPAYVNGLGLISAYETVLNRAREFSIDAVPPQDYGPTNDALLNISSRLATFYLALGNEAYADAVDPTIGFSTKSAEYGSMAPSVFSFQNQLDSLLDEEMALMRGRDDSATTTRNAPYYNRLVWNFTQGEGEVAYAQNYNITDQDGSGVINAADARIMYPQGHGDAWGHYLQAINYYYRLVGHPNFTWEPRVEYVLVAGNPTMVDYLDERKFASIAAARAKAGAEILDLTYKKFYTDDPAGQWQGYKDTYADRAWGVDEWARRAGQGAFFDWVTANAILPDSVPATRHDRTRYVTNANGALVAETIPGAGIQQIDRTKVPELSSIASHFQRIQTKMTEVDSGINPLGLVKGVVPFDIDPVEISAGKTHFEQVYERAEKALANAVAAYDYANGYTERLRQNQDTLEQFKKNLADQERDYKNRLIEIFGYPYADDIGAGKTYPDGYDGPDIFHYNYVDLTELTGKPVNGYTTYTSTITNGTVISQDLGVGVFTEDTHTVSYNITSDGNWLVKPSDWTSKRRAPGKIQQALSGLITAHADLQRSNKKYEGMIDDLESKKKDLEKRYDMLGEEVRLRNEMNGEVLSWTVAMVGLKATSALANAISEHVKEKTEIILESIPKVVGTATDATAPVRGTLKGGGGLASNVFKGLSAAASAGADYAASRIEAAKAGFSLKIENMNKNYESILLYSEMERMLSDIDQQLLETWALKETVVQALGNYDAALAEGMRLMDELAEKRAQSAAEVQEYRFQDMGFRVFRNDAIQKYRAQFDLAAKYVYLAATAYDYETNLLGSASGAGRKFLSEIGRQSAPGVISNGVPQAGFPGLADIMARLSQNFAVYKTQLGFNNPQTETTPFSLRTELFRIRADATSGDVWRDKLKDLRVDDLWKIPEFKRYCRPFAPESAGPQPGIVIKFPTTITYGKNFFGWPLSGGDSAYSSSNFSTRIRSAGVWFQNYNNSGLSSTPRVYLVPVGADILRSPAGDGFTIREWQVRDQKIPVPFPIGDSDLTNPLFIPTNDSLSDEMSGMRKLSDFRAYPYSGEFNAGETTSDSRLIGRSVWNTQWMMIIPGSTLLFNKDVGLNNFINSVDDIKMFFQTYSYSGN